VALLAHAAAAPKGETGEEAETLPGKNGDLLIRGPPKIRNLHLIDSPVMVDFPLGK
jgi:hypothetical protein